MISADNNKHPGSREAAYHIAVGTETADKEIMTMPVMTVGDKEKGPCICRRDVC
jgi:hypothetical protein